jgi:hypothetical protein
MNRWIVAVGLLLSAGLSFAHADYLRIIYDVGAARNPNNPQPGLNFPVGPGNPLFPGIPGAQPKPPGGQIQPPQGFPGGQIKPPPGIPGGPGFPGMQPKPNQPNAAARDDDSGLRADVVVEYHKKEGQFLKLYADPNRRSIKQFPLIFHKWGKTAITPTYPDIKLEEVKDGDVNLPPVAKRYQTQRNLKLKDKDGKINKTPEALLELAEWALNHAMLDKFTDLMEELRAVNPSQPELKAFDTIQSALRKPVSLDDSALAIWRPKFSTFKVKKSDHYVLLYSSLQADAPEADEYLNRLEENLRGCLYWFTLKQKALPVPERRLLNVLVDKTDEFTGYRQVFDTIPLVADGFYSKRENVGIYSANRLDEAFALVTRATAPLQQNGWNATEMLQGQGHEGASSPEEVVRNQMLFLLLKGMQEESSLATVSHNGTRQLLFATGLLTRNVAVPEWIQFGAASFFETPKGAFWPGIGAPSWKYGVKFKAWKTPLAPGMPKTLEDSAIAIRNVITDQYFRAIKSESDKEAVAKARTMAWSLTFFLMNRKIDNLMRYFQELNALPRDLEFDPDTLTLTFARAFDLVDSSTGGQVNEAKLNQLAEEWYAFIDLTPIESSEAMHDAVKQHAAQQKNKKNQAQPVKPPAMTKPPANPKPKIK